jgi:hypothetical protein
MPSGPHFMGIAVRQRIAPTGAFVFFAALPIWVMSATVDGDAYV